MFKNSKGVKLMFNCGVDTGLMTTNVLCLQCSDLSEHARFIERCFKALSARQLRIRNTQHIISNLQQIL